MGRSHCQSQKQKRKIHILKLNWFCNMTTQLRVACYRALQVLLYMQEVAVWKLKIFYLN